MQGNGASLNTAISTHSLSSPGRFVLDVFRVLRALLSSVPPTGVYLFLCALHCCHQFFVFARLSPKANFWIQRSVVHSEARSDLQALLILGVVSANALAEFERMEHNDLEIMLIHTSLDTSREAKNENIQKIQRTHEREEAML